MTNHRRDKSLKKSASEITKDGILDKDIYEISIQNEIDELNTYLENAKNIEKTIPSIQRKKEDAEARQKIFKQLPSDVAIEFAPSLIKSQRASEDYVKATLPNLPAINTNLFDSTSGSSGAGTVFVTCVQNIINSLPYLSMPGSWGYEVKASIGTYVDTIAQREYLPKRLNNLYPTLGEAFNIALANFDSCKAGTYRVNSSAMQLRDVLNQIWANLIDLARKNNKNPKIKIVNFQMKTLADRSLISKILGKDEYQRNKLDDHLGLLFRLYLNLSETNFGKNPLNEDLEKLISYYEQWIVLIDDITGIVCT